MDKEEWKFVKKKKKENGKENKEGGVIKNNWGRRGWEFVTSVWMNVYKYIWDSFLVRSVFFFFLHAYSNFKTFSSRRFVPRKLSPTS